MIQIIFSKIVRRQLGVIYHHYLAQAERGVLIGDANLTEFTAKLKSHFENVKDKTKARLGKQNQSKTRKPRDGQNNPKDRRKMLYRKYLRS